MDGWADGWTCRLGEWAGDGLITAGYPSMPQNTFDMFFFFFFFWGGGGCL